MTKINQFTNKLGLSIVILLTIPSKLLQQTTQAVKKLILPCRVRPGKGPAIRKPGGGDGFFGKKYFVFTFGEKKYFVFHFGEKKYFVFNFGEKK